MARRSKNPTPQRFDGPDEASANLRSRTMRAVKSKDTGPEMVVRRFLHAAGFRYRLHDRRLPGVPDLVFPRWRIVLFVHGCFWHQHSNCEAATRPKSGVDFWTRKLDGNIARDARHRTALEAAGWEVLTIWECEVRDPRRLMHLIQQLGRHLLLQS